MAPSPVPSSFPAPGNEPNPDAGADGPRDDPPSRSARPGRRGFLALGAVGVAAVAAPGIAAAGAARPTTVRVGDTVDEHNPEIAAEDFFLRRLGELTGGRLSGHTYPNAALGSHDRMNEQLRNGTLEVAKTSVANLEVYDRRMGIFALPYAFASRSHLFAAQDGALGRRLAAILERHGLLVLGWFDSGLRNLYSVRGPVREPADMRRLKVRVQENQIMIDTFNALGALATPVPTEQIYSALQQGVVQAAENSVTFYVQQHHQEVAKYYSNTRHFFSVDPLLVSKRWFSRLAGADQDAVLRAGHEAQQRERALWLQSDRKYLRIAQQHGTHVNDADVEAFRKAVSGVYDRHRATFKDLLRHTDWR